jgi:hypothetical protein
VGSQLGLNKYNLETLEVMHGDFSTLMMCLHKEGSTGITVSRLLSTRVFVKKDGKVHTAAA